MKLTLEQIEEGERLRAENAWQPIETAPKDGTRIVAGTRVNHTSGYSFWDAHVVWFDDEEGEIASDAYQGWAWDDYTHWLPLPTPPEGESND